MANDFRARFALSQERLAEWLGINRTSLALFETGQRGLPLGVGAQYARLSLAAAGLVLSEGGTAATAPPLPPPAPDTGPLVARLNRCRYLARNQRYALEQMREHAIPYEARLAILPALRAWTGPVLHPKQEKNWLDLFEAEAIEALGNDCGPGPQGLLEARIAGLEREAELLEKLLATLPPAP